MVTKKYLGQKILKAIGLNLILSLFETFENVPEYYKTMEREVMKNTPVAGFIQVTNKKRFCDKDLSVCIMGDNRRNSQSQIPVLANILSLNGDILQDDFHAGNQLPNDRDNILYLYLEMFLLICIFCLRFPLFRDLNISP